MHTKVDIDIDKLKEAGTSLMMHYSFSKIEIPFIIKCA